MTPKILCIDDSQMVRAQVKRALGPSFTLVEAVDGMDALEKLQANTDIALIICDVNMPRMSGLEFLESKAGNAGISAIPVVMLTTEGQQEMIQKAKSLGARGWVVKPFKPESLVAIAKKVTGVAA
jgi:two-component system chemotaxis response regulator CheY